MNDEQWSWISAVLGIQRGGQAGDGVSEEDEEATPEPLVLDMESMVQTNDSPINTVAFASGGATGGGTGTPPAQTNTTPVPTATVSKSDPDRKAVDAAMADVSKRYKAITDPAGTFEMNAANKAFFTVYTPWRVLYDASDFATAKSQIAGVEAKLAALEKLAADLPKKTKAASDEAAKINKMKPKDLAKLPVEDKTKMVETLLAGGKPTGEARKAQIAIYKSMTLDKGFMKADEQRGKAIATELKGDKELKTARKNWKTVSEADKIKMLKKVVAAQCKQFGIPVPDLVIEHDPPKDGLVTNGYFSPSDGKLHINLDPASSAQNFQRAVDLAIHENAHNWQAKLVEDLKAGKIKKGDANYEQALMFSVNELHPGGYVAGSEDYEAYKKQPLENHAWTTGPSTAKKIMKGV